MKPLNVTFFHICGKLLGLLCILFSQSCSLENFPQPLPIDVKDEARFPEILQGQWLTTEDSNYVFIGKKYLIFTDNIRPAKVVKGVWPKILGIGKLKELGYGYESERYQHYDSSYQPIDTARNYIITKEAIYEVRGGGMLSMGYPYRENSDTLEFLKKDSVWFDLGRNMSIKQLGKGLYALNINNTILAQESNWWQLTLIEIVDKDTVKCWGVSEKMKDSPSFIYYFEEKYFSSAYYECYWTAKDIRRLMADSSFDVKAIFVKEGIPSK